MVNFTRILLKAKEERELEQGFPWVYDNEVGSVKWVGEGSPDVRTTSLESCQVADGAIVEVFTGKGGFLGTGVLNRSSKIVVRLIGRDHADQIMADAGAYWSKVIRNAVNIRRLHYAEDESYRIIFGEADMVPGFVAERFVSEGKVYLVVQFLALACEVFRKEILSALDEACHPYGIYERSDAAIREREGLKQRAGWLGSQRHENIIIRENGLSFLVDIAHGQKTGYFLDQKYNRAQMARFCHGKRVLDACTHTGAFGLNAVGAGAREVIGVDISPEMVEMTRKNIELNHAEGRMSVVCADVFDLLKQYEAEGQKFDVIVLDPPAFTKSAKQIQKAYGGYKELNLRAMRLLQDGGILVTCSCSYYFDGNTFYSMLMHAAKDSRRRVQVLEKRGAGPDHPVLLGYPQSEYLKCAFCRVL